MYGQFYTANNLTPTVGNDQQNQLQPGDPQQRVQRVRSDLESLLQDIQQEKSQAGEARQKLVKIIDDLYKQRGELATKERRLEEAHERIRSLEKNPECDDVILESLAWLGGGASLGALLNQLFNWEIPLLMAFSGSALSFIIALYMGRLMDLKKVKK